MPIKSYLVHPHSGKKDELSKILSDFDHCEVIPAKNREVLILVTDTSTKKEEETLKLKIEALESLKLLAMVSGFNTPKNN